ncbi:hypothetical protein ST47_g2085 [Ascochyta rabiei]|uniref:Uncharacterized protein n=1 Tax=Didymella rabiei TaxID=5454 RepID=A0A163K560_DIDRA|nr:hypothetical protein ST47_g2085 [Ascochyta rabiei]
MAYKTTKYSRQTSCYISAALFWGPENSSSGSCATIWPNLRVLDVSTGLERSTGDYWLRSAAEYPYRERYDFPEPEDSDSDHPDSEMWRLAGRWPSRQFRTRPEPKFFDELAISIAHAAANMPKLEYLDLEFNASHQSLLDPSITSFHQGMRRTGGPPIRGLGILLSCV